MLAVLLPPSSLLATLGALEPQQGEITVLCPHFLRCQLGIAGSLGRAPRYGSNDLVKARPGTLLPDRFGLLDTRAGPRMAGNVPMDSGNVGWILVGRQEDGDKRS
jgi:hypothetical protein